MAIQDEIGRRTSASAGDLAAHTGKGTQDAPKAPKDPGKPSPNPHHEHQDRHGSGEGLTGMQPGAGHPRGR
jgi:hypothetical protein